jgi:hypothetical protein
MRLTSSAVAAPMLAWLTLACARLDPPAPGSPTIVLAAPSAAPTPGATAVATGTTPRLACPPPEPSLLDSNDAPSWERDPLGRWPRCLETTDGARVLTTKDETDPDGWRAFLVVEDTRGVRFRLTTRAVSAMGLAKDGSVALAHVEDKVTLVSPQGAVVWSTEHPRCGAPEVSVGHMNEVVLGCGYSLLKFAPDGRFLWQKWPLGNTSISKPLLLRDGAMIVSGGGVVAGLDADGSVKWRVETGWNRHVLRIGARANGDLVFRTAMAALHSDGPIRMYYEHEPPEVFIVSRGGRIVSREEVERAPEGGYPSSLPWTPDLRSGRWP